MTANFKKNANFVTFDNVFVDTSYVSVSNYEQFIFDFLIL